jgi:hypothetical protein
MCGLFGGISTTLTGPEIERIRELGLVSQVRGLDSTGVAMVYRKKNQYKGFALKDVENASTFLYSKEFFDACFETKPFLIAGHVRSATVGDIVSANAHPFDLGGLIGMHNGTVANIEGKHPDGTDSEALLRLLKNRGLQYAVNAARSGAYALVWVDGNNATLNFIRNGARTLYTMVAGGVFYWASEFYILKMIADRNQLSIQEAPKLLEVHTHLQIGFNNPLYNQKRYKVEPKWDYGNYATKEDIKVTHTVLGPVVKPTEEFEPDVDVDGKPWKDNIPKSSGVPAIAPPKKEYQYDKTGVRYQAFKGKTMGLEKARELLKEGCAFCTHEVKDHEEGKAFWFTHKSYLCENCAHDEFARNDVNAKKIYPGRILVEKCSGNC